MHQFFFACLCGLIGFAFGVIVYEGQLVPARLAQRDALHRSAMVEARLTAVARQDADRRAEMRRPAADLIPAQHLPTAP